MTAVRGLDVDPERLTDQDLVPDRFWGHPCIGVNIQADLAAPESASLAAALRALPSALPGQYPVPQPSLHLSVLNVIHARDSTPAHAKLALLAANRDRWIRLVDGVARDTEPFDIDLSLVVPAPAGVLLVARDCPELVDLRIRLLRRLGLPDAAAQLCHVTLLRFGADPPAAALLRSVTAELEVDVTMRVSTLRTVRELVYPSLQRETIRCHRLGSHRPLSGGPVG